MKKKIIPSSFIEGSNIFRKAKYNHPSSILRELLSKEDHPGFQSEIPISALFISTENYQRMLLTSVYALRKSGWEEGIEVYLIGKNKDWYSIPFLQENECLINFIPETDRHILGYKSLALSLSKAERVIYIDSDCYVLKNPIDLFEKTSRLLVASDPYPPPIDWNVLAPEIPIEKRTPPIQGSWFIIDRSRCNKLINIWNWCEDNYRYFYQHLYSDQEILRLLLSFLGWEDVVWLPNEDRDQIHFINGVENPFALHMVHDKIYHFGQKLPEWKHPFIKELNGILDTIDKICPIRRKQ